MVMVKETHNNEKGNCDPDGKNAKRKQNRVLGQWNGNPQTKRPWIVTHTWVFIEEEAKGFKVTLHY